MAQSRVGDAKEQAEWERVQVKTFTKWVNSHLNKRGLKVDSLATDLADGIKLIVLLEVISQESLGKYDPKPRMRINQIENVNKALKFIAAHDVKLVGIGAEEIVDGNQKMILGMIWTIILRFAISGLSEEGLSAKEGLLQWVRRKTEPYKNVDVKDFSVSFQDGLAFCALIHRHRPDLLDYDKLTSADKLGNLNLAFDVSLKHLDVPRLLDAEDIVNMPRPDERSIMTYTAQLYKVFSNLDQAETAGRRVAKYAEASQQLADMLHDYERRTKILVGAVSAKTTELNTSPVGDDYPSIKGHIGSLNEYKKTTRRQWITEQADLATLFGNIQAKLKTLQRPPYVPPSGLSVPEVETQMETLNTATRDRRSKLNSTLRALLDRLRQEFATPANAFGDKLKHLKEALASGSGELEEQLAFYAGKQQEVRALQGQLPTLQGLEQRCNDANIEDNEFTDHTYDDLLFEYEQISKNYGKKVAFIESQILAAKQANNIAPEQLAEFKEAFNNFDSKRNGRLSKLDFKSLLSALGLIEIDFEGKSDKKLEEIFKQVGGGSEEITFDQFLPYITKLTADTVSPDQIQSSFETIAGGKQYVTLNDFKVAGVPAAQIQFLTSNMPKYPGVNDAYDFKAFISTQK
jgi:Ca2+-binding EF-hand superfamily protein